MDNFEILEGKFTRQRIRELRVNPIRGSFDIPHLKAINRYIFQDMPLISDEAAFIYTPGEFRPEVKDKNKDWIKRRMLKSIRRFSYAAYSPMDAESIAELEKILSGAIPERLGSLEKQDFVKTLAKLYGDLDYIHPFRDGNSRTLREFTRTLAAESGYVLDWAKLNTGPQSPDLLYIARDRAVGLRAIDRVRDESSKREIYFTLDTYENNPSLEALLDTAVTKMLIKSHTNEASVSLKKRRH